MKFLWKILTFPWRTIRDFPKRVKENSLFEIKLDAFRDRTYRDILTRREMGYSWFAFQKSPPVFQINDFGKLWEREAVRLEHVYRWHPLYTVLQKSKDMQRIGRNG